MKRFNWTLAVLTACAILGALPILASCESDTPPGPTTDDNFPLCEGNKSDDPSCPVALPGEDASSSDAEQGSSPDTAPPEQQKPAHDYTGEKCPDLGCVLTPDGQGDWDCGEPPDFPPDSLVITGLETDWVPAYCGLPAPTTE